MQPYRLFAAQCLLKFFYYSVREYATACLLNNTFIDGANVQYLHCVRFHRLAWYV